MFSLVVMVVCIVQSTVVGDYVNVFVAILKFQSCRRYKGFFLTHFLVCFAYVTTF